MLGQNPAISELFSLLPQTAHCKFPGHSLVLFVVVVFLFVVVVVVVFWWWADGSDGRCWAVGRMNTSSFGASFGALFSVPLRTF